MAKTLPDSGAAVPDLNDRPDIGVIVAALTALDAKNEVQDSIIIGTGTAADNAVVTANNARDVATVATATANDARTTAFSASTGLAALTSTVGNKADSSRVFELETAVSGKTSFQDLAAGLEGKADNSDIDFVLGIADLKQTKIPILSAEPTDLGITAYIDSTREAALPIQPGTTAGTYAAGDDSRVVGAVQKGSLVINVKDYGAVGNGTTDDTAAIQAAINAAGAPGPASPLGTSARIGCVVYLPPGYYRITAQLVVAVNSVVLKGAGRTATHINAATTFPASTAMVSITNESGTVFGSRIESLTINCNGITGSIGVVTTTGQEGVGIYDARIRDFKDTGLRIKNTGATDPAAEIFVDLSEFWGHTAGSNYGIDVDAAVGAVYIDRSTIRPVQYGGTHVAAIRNNNAQVSCRNLHLEAYPDGIYTVGGGRTLASQIKGYNGIGSTSTTALINLANDNSSGVFEGIYNGTGNTFYSLKYSRTSASGYINRVSVAPSSLTAFYKTDSVMGQFEVRGQDTSIPLFVARNTNARAAQSLAQFEDGDGNITATIAANGQIMAKNVRITGVSTKTGTYTASAADAVILVSGTNTQTLPPAALGLSIAYKNIGTSTVTLVGQATSTIDGAANKALSTQYDGVTLVSDGTNWFIVK